MINPVGSTGGMTFRKSGEELKLRALFRRQPKEDDRVEEDAFDPTDPDHERRYA